MLKDGVLMPLHRRFKSGTNWEPIGFFSDGFCNSRTFDLQLGFFSSSAISLLSDGFASFLYNGGKMRMIINDILSKEDKKAIENGQSNTNIEQFDLNDIEKIKNTLSERNKHFFECLSWLIRHNRLDIVIISPKNKDGISHTKTGIFCDGENTITFEGSCNFSGNALLQNIESFTISCDWDGPVAIANIDEIKRDFNETFDGRDDTVEYRQIDEVKTRILTEFERKELGTLLEDEEKLIKKHRNVTISDTIKKALSRAQIIVQKEIRNIKKNDKMKYKPVYPYPDGPRKVYQETAYKNWAVQQNGMFNMATGTGKTVTALNVLFHLYQNDNLYKAIILVPTITLVNQWEKECKHFHFDKVVKICSVNSSWRAELDDIKYAEQLSELGFEESPSYVIITTYASFTQQSVFTLLNDLDNRLLLIADECHNMGSPKIKECLPKLKYTRKVGLSATPKRQFDDEGNIIINSFFGIKDNYTFEYSMEEAISKGVLCKYYYYPHVIYLNDAEMEEYKSLSKSISKFYNSRTDSFKKDPILTALLLKRKRIIHKAINKEKVFRDIILKNYKEKGNLKYTLVYVPEGIKADENDDIFDNTDSIGNDSESKHLIDIYTGIVSEVSHSTTVMEFTSDSENRDDILEKFASGDIEVLTSMKCLDEGVDVPRSETAIFCASTGNPRQFIQRRGRILRIHPEKKIAYIHDLVVAPLISSNSDNYKTERNLLKNELQRVKDFASLSINRCDTDIALDEVITYYNLTLYES